MSPDFRPPEFRKRNLILTEYDSRVFLAPRYCFRLIKNLLAAAQLGKPPTPKSGVTQHRFSIKAFYEYGC